MSNVPLPLSDTQLQTQQSCMSQSHTAQCNTWSTIKIIVPKDLLFTCQALGYQWWLVPGCLGGHSSCRNYASWKYSSVRSFHFYDILRWIFVPSYIDIHVSRPSICHHIQKVHPSLSNLVVNVSGITFHLVVHLNGVQSCRPTVSWLAIGDSISQHICLKSSESIQYC